MTRTLIIAPIFICLFALLAAIDPAPNPQEAARVNNIGVAYMNQQLFEKGLKAFEEAAAKDPNLKVTTLNRGVALLNLQRIDEAKPLLEKASKDDPNDPHSFYSLGLYYKNSSDPEKAVTAFRRVTEIDPNDADTWYFLGSTYAQLKQFPEAISAFEHALKIDPLHASAHFGLARAYQQSGQADPAHEAMKKFQYVTQNKLGAPISLAYGEQGKYSRAEESPVAVEKVVPQIPLKFADVTASAGLPKKRPVEGQVTGAVGPGACFIDYDGDGLIDIFLTDRGKSGGLSLYHNLGNGKFEEVTKQAGLEPTLHAASCAIGDYDNDGAPDLALGFAGPHVLLLHNDKNGRFSLATIAGGVASLPKNNEPGLVEIGPAGAALRASGPVPGLNFVDYDHDGDIDLYITNLSFGAGGEPCYWCEKIPRNDNEFGNEMWRNNGDKTFTDVTATLQFGLEGGSISSVGTDYNNDRAIDLVVTGTQKGPVIFENPREGTFPLRQPWPAEMPQKTLGVAVLDFNHDGWMDLAFTHWGAPGISLWQNKQGKTFERVSLPKVDWVRADGVVAVDYDNDGWVDLVAVGETKDGKGEVRLFRNLGPDGWKDVTTDVGLDKIQLKEPRAIIAGDYDNDGAVDLLITQNHGPAVLLRNEGGNKNNSLRLALKGLNDNKSAIGTKVEVFSAGLRQKFEVYGSSGYLGQNSPYLTIGLGQAKEADVVRMLWPTGVLQDEIEVAANKRQEFLEIDRRGSSCPTLFAWDGTHYALVGDMLGAGVVGHWVGPPQGLKPTTIEALNDAAEQAAEKLIPAQKARPQRLKPHSKQCSYRSAEALRHPKPSARLTFSAACEAVPYPKPIYETGSSVVRNIARPTEYIKLDRNMLREKYDSHPSQKPGRVGQPRSDIRVDENPERDHDAHVSQKRGNVGHPLRDDSGPSRNRGQGDSHPVLSFRFMEPLEESVYLDQVELVAVDHPANLEVYPNEYFASNPPYPTFKVVFARDARPPAGAWDDHGHDVLPDLLAHRYFGDFKVLSFAGFTEPHSLELDLGEPYRGGPLWLLMHGEIEYFTATSMYAADQAHLQPFAPYVEALNEKGQWVRVIDDLGFPAGGARTMTADLTDRLPQGTRRIRLTTNLQIYWDNILISRTDQHQASRLTPVPLVRADLSFHGFPLKIEGQPPGNVKYAYEKASPTGPYTRPAGAYTRYGDVRPLLAATDDKFVVFGSGDEVALEFDPANLPTLPQGWVRDYFFAAHGYEKDMDFYAYRGDAVEPLPYREMATYPYPGKPFPSDAEHFNYLLEYNTRFMSGNEASGYSFQYPK